MNKYKKRDCRPNQAFLDGRLSDDTDIDVAFEPFSDSHVRLAWDVIPSEVTGRASCQDFIGILSRKNLMQGETRIRSVEAIQGNLSVISHVLFGKLARW
jgi:hypothetical protein